MVNTTSAPGNPASPAPNQNGPTAKGSPASEASPGRDRLHSSTTSSVRRPSYAIKDEQRSPRRQMTAPQLLQLHEMRRNSVSSLDVESEDEEEIDYRDNFQIIIGQALADTVDMVDSNLSAMKERLLDVIPPERIARNSVLRINHLRPLPPRIAPPGAQPKLRCLTKLPTKWYVGHAVKPTPIIELYDASTGLPIPGWSSALSVRATVLNGCEDVVHERYDGRSVCVGGKAWLVGSEAEFPALRVLDESSRHKRGLFYLVFHMPDYCVEPWKSPPITMEDIRSATTKPSDAGEYMYEEETEEVVEFSIPAHHNPEEDTEEMIEARKGQISPLHVACVRGQVQVVQLLLEKGDDVNYAESHGLTALHLACYIGYRELVETLVNNGAAVEQESMCGFTALQYAILSCRIDLNSRMDVIRFLLAQPKVDVKHKSYEGWTALHVAAHCGKAEVVSQLLSRGAEVDAQSIDGQTPLHIAAFHGHVRCLKTLVDAGAKADVKASNGWSSAMQAVMGGSYETLAALINDYSAAPDQAATSGHTPLSAAALTAKVQSIDLLLSKGAKGGFLAGSGWSPVMCASASGDLTSVERCVQAKIPVIGGNGDSALGVAAAFGHKEVCDYLKEYVPRDHADQAALKKTPPGMVTQQSTQGIALLEKKHKKAVNWKRGDVASHETLVRVLKEGDEKSQMDALSTINEDMKLSDADCRSLVDHGVMQCLLNYIRQERTGNVILTQALRLLKRLASCDATKVDIHLTALIRDLIAAMSNASTAADIATILDQNHDLQGAMNAQKEGATAYLTLSTHFGGAKIGGAAGLGAAQGSSGLVRASSGLSSSSPRPLRQNSKPLIPATAPPSQPPPSLPQGASKKGGGASSANSGGAAGANGKGQGASGGSSSSAGGGGSGSASARSDMSISNASWAELLAERLVAHDHVGIFVTGRSGAGRSTLITQALGKGATAPQVIKTDEGEILSQNITMGERAVTLYDHKGLDPSVDSHVDAWFCITQFIINSLANPDSQEAKDLSRPPRVSTVWYCVDNKLEPVEQEWITALAEYVPVVIVLTKAHSDARKTREVQQFIERVSPPLPFFEPIVPVHAKAEGKGEQVDGFNDLASVTAKAYDDARRMVSVNQKTAASATSDRLIGSMARHCAHFIAPVLHSVKLLAVVGIPLNHAGTTLEPVGVPMIKGIAHVFGLPWSDQTVSTVWTAVFSRADFLKSLFRASSGAASSTSMDITNASTVLVALGVGMTHVLAEHAVSGSLLSTQMNAIMSAIVEQIESSVQRGHDALMAEYNGMRAGKLEARGEEEVDVM
eukprot:TRINITY_DN2658_c0_g1_i1.p1 TRINITY_DN2658_c0_g1~~TRINITY_DN2658_c0_g1_i1.p1  ORF type:complete len:1305 (-),score=340.71 TRINITY_DN2658_c0_g1_i1:266-4180(-)